jgi:hypothetical protein
MVFETTGALDVVCDDVVPIFRQTWQDLASPGTYWTGAERVGIAAVARGARAGRFLADGELPTAAVAAAATLAAAPSEVDQDWVETATSALGEGRYVELAGVVACLMAVDTILALGGSAEEPLPEPLPGAPTGRRPVRGLKKRSAWVSMAGPPLPRFSLSAVPATQRTMNRLLDRLYFDMNVDAARSARQVRGLSRVQMELVILAVSHGNECFY